MTVTTERLGEAAGVEGDEFAEEFFGELVGVQLQGLGDAGRGPTELVAFERRMEREFAMRLAGLRRGMLRHGAASFVDSEGGDIAGGTVVEPDSGEIEIDVAELESLILPEEWLVVEASPGGSEAHHGVGKLVPFAGSGGTELAGAADCRFRRKCGVGLCVDGPDSVVA